LTQENGERFLLGVGRNSAYKLYQRIEDEGDLVDTPILNGFEIDVTDDVPTGFVDGYKMEISLMTTYLGSPSYIQV